MSLPSHGWLERPWPRRSWAMQRKPLEARMEHLRLPRVGAERPAVAEVTTGAGAPVLVVDLRAVLGGDRAHGSPFAGRVDGLSIGGRAGGHQRSAEHGRDGSAAGEQTAAGGRHDRHGDQSRSSGSPSSIDNSVGTSAASTGTACRSTRRRTSPAGTNPASYLLPRRRSRGAELALRQQGEERDPRQGEDSVVPYKAVTKAARSSRGQRRPPYTRFIASSV